MLHLITCHGCIMPHLAELLFMFEAKVLLFVFLDHLPYRLMFLGCHHADNYNCLFWHIADMLRIMRPYSQSMEC